MTQEPGLSEREQEILRLVATGASNKEIAQQLVISANTVKVHLRNIFAKIGVVSRTEATLYAIREGLVPTPGGQPAQNQDAGEAASRDGMPGTVLAAPAGQAASRRGWLWLSVAALVLLLAAGGLGLRGLFNPPALPAAPTPAPTPSRWESRAPLPEPRAYMAAAVYENAVYVIGGETEAGVTGAVTRYDPEADRWEERAEKPTPVRDIRAVAISDKLFVPGGLLPDGSPTSNLEVYDPQMDRWDQKKSLPVPLSDYALAEKNGFLYVFGGRSGDKISNHVYQYDPILDEWNEAPAMPTARADASAVVDGERILVIGGFGENGPVSVSEAFYPGRVSTAGNVWEKEKPLPEDSGPVSIAALSGSIYAFRPSPADQVFVFSDDQKEWYLINQADILLADHAAVLPYHVWFFLIGGRNQEQYSADFYSYQALFTLSLPLVQ